MKYMVSVAVLLGLNLISGSVRADVFNEIDARFQQGKLSEAMRQLYRVAAIRNRAILPRDLRTQAIAGRSWREATSILVDAYQWAQRNGPQGAPILHALAPKSADVANYFDSATLPIRVNYTTLDQQTLAQTVLRAAEYSWNVETKDYGFYAPLVTEGERYQVTIESTGFGPGGYTAPTTFNDATPWNDCFTYIVIDPEVGLGAESVVSHEFNHAMQAAMDCMEISTFWENTATYIETQVYPSSWDETMMYVRYFQNAPWRALDYMNRSQSDLAEYGGVLWSLYLTNTFAPDDGPVFMRQIWEACMGTGTTNEPDYFEAIAKTIPTRGGPTSFEQVFMDFSESRYFIGDNDDGAHLAVAQEVWRGEPATVAEYMSTTLPQDPDSPASPPMANRPAPFGSNHIVVMMQAGRDYTMDFTGDAGTRWAVRAVLPQTDKEPLARFDMEIDTARHGTITVPGSKNRRALFVVANLGKKGYSPNSANWAKSSYTYTITANILPAVVTAIEPAEIMRGQDNVAIKLIGSGFVSGKEFTITFADPAIQVISIDKVTSTTVDLTVKVNGSAKLGTTDVTVTNQGGAQTLGAQLLDIIAGSGEGCTMAPITSKGSLALFGLWTAALFLLGIRRYRLRRG